MSTPNPSAPYPILAVTEHPSIGMPAVKVTSVPDWIKESIYPRASEDRKPLLDIYAEVIRLHSRIAVLEEEIRNISTRVHTPWYKRLYDWLTQSLRS